MHAICLTAALKCHLEGRNVDGLHARVLAEDPEHGQLCADGLSRSCRRSQQYIFICVIQCVERLQQADIQDLASMSFELDCRAGKVNHLSMILKSHLSAK